MKKLSVVFMLLLSVLFIFLFGIYFWWVNASSAISSTKQEKSFLIKRGQDAQNIGQELYKQGFIKSPLAFKVYVQLKGLSEKIPSGEYMLSPSYTLPEVVSILLKGPVQIWVSIPEGLRREEIAQRLINALEIPKKDSEEFRGEFLRLTQGKEGYLFPDTYLFPKNVTPHKVVNVMEVNFEKRVTKEMRSDIEKQGRTLEQVIVLASIVERETKTDKERPVVAGLLLARLKEGFLLQADASLQYGLANLQCKKASDCANWWPKVTRSDYTNLQSPYNVYKYQGLPPTPICNPGLSAIKAVIYPEETEYRYYIHDANGKIHFAKTLKEHNENVSRYLR